jgi:diacylglycerol kinase family enzyme
VVNVIKGIAEHYVVELNGKRIAGEHTFVCVCNGRYYGGGFNPVPEADPADGLLDVLLVKKVSRLQVPGIIGKYKSGRYKELPKIIRHYRTKEIKIFCDKETPINLDGELRTAQQVTMSISDKKLRFFYPKGLVWQSKVPQTVG